MSGYPLISLSWVLPSAIPMHHWVDAKHVIADSSMHVAPQYQWRITACVAHCGCAARLRRQHTAIIVAAGSIVMSVFLKNLKEWYADIKFRIATRLYLCRGRFELFRSSSLSRCGFSYSLQSAKKLQFKSFPIICFLGISFDDIKMGVMGYLLLLVILWIGLWFNNWTDVDTTDS